MFSSQRFSARFPEARPRAVTMNQTAHVQAMQVLLPVLPLVSARLVQDCFNSLLHLGLDLLLSSGPSYTG